MSTTSRVLKTAAPLLAAMLVIGVRTVAGQETQPTPAELARQIDAQGKLLEQQRVLIETLTRQLEETNRLVASTSQRLQELERVAQSTAATAEERLATVEQEVRKLPELQATLVAGDFPGALEIPGSDAAMRFGGQVRLSVVRNIGAIGSDDRFVTSSIPAEGSPDADKTDRTTLSPAPSRLNVDLRTKTPYGNLRAFVEGDFGGANRTYRLRHAFGSWRGFTIGQTWSTFSDPEAEPDGIDFEGLNAISLFRQPIVRWTTSLSKRYSFALAAENPAPDLTGANGVSQVPDLIARLRFDRHGNFVPGNLFSGRGHSQVAVLLRQVRGEPADRPNQTLSTTGIGVHVSGRFAAPWAERDQITFASAAGTGIGRYITDLGSLGGQDAVYDSATNTLQGLPVYSTYGGYEHWWSDRVRSTVTFGGVFVDNLDIQVGDALRRTLRGSVNLAWSPIPRVDLVAEFLTGTRVNKDRTSGDASQVQVGWTFRF
jgi:hypothetical protein